MSGEKNPMSKMSNDDVFCIRHLNSLGVPHSFISKAIGLSRPSVTNICLGKEWRKRLVVIEDGQISSVVKKTCDN
jgi:hypothetical protein